MVSRPTPIRRRSVVIAGVDTHVFAGMKGNACMLRTRLDVHVTMTAMMIVMMTDGDDDDDDGDDHELEADDDAHDAPFIKTHILVWCYTTATRQNAPLHSKVFIYTSKCSTCHA